MLRTTSASSGERGFERSNPKHGNPWRSEAERAEEGSDILQIKGRPRGLGGFRGPTTLTTKVLFWSAPILSCPTSLESQDLYSPRWLGPKNFMPDDIFRSTSFVNHTVFNPRPLPEGLYRLVTFSITRSFINRIIEVKDICTPRIRCLKYQKICIIRRGEESGRRFNKMS